MREFIWGPPCIHASHTPGTARRSVGETVTAMTAGSKRAATRLIAGRHGLCRILPERERGPSAHRARARRHKTTQDDTK
jgi:hypothetical protein